MYYTGEFKDLKKYGFFEEAQGTCYEIKKEQCNIFIWKHKKDPDYEYRKIYIEYKNGNVIIDDLKELYNLIFAGLVRL